jgi:apolipoprotein N-acyltransferase
VLRRLALALVGGLSLVLAFEPVGASYVVPVSVAAFVLATVGLPASRAWLPGLVFGIAFCYPLMFWMRVVGYDAWAAMSGVEALFLGLLGAVVALLHRLPAWPVWVATAWVAVEQVRTSWPLGGMPWGRLSYATADTPWASALPYVGQAGLGFLLALAGSSLAWLVLGPGRRQRLVAGATAVGALALATLPALAPWTPDTTGHRTVAVVQGNVPGEGDDILLDPRQVTQNHVQATIDLGADIDAGREPRPDFVLWPENSTASDPFLDAGLNLGIETAVDAVGVPVLVGAMVDSGPDHVLNQGIVWTPGVGAGDRYTKWHPVPFGEYIPWRSFFSGNIGRLALIPRDMLSGTRTEPLTVDGTRVADAICFDVAYDDGIHAQLRNGADLLVVQTSNATFIKTDQIEQQFEITRLRAIETGRYVAVASTNGVSGIIAPDGTVVDRAEPRTTAVLVDQVGLSDQITPAVRIGQWFGRACVAVTVVGLLVALVAYRRPRGEQA